jgi:hypothetical protein
MYNTSICKETKRSDRVSHSFKHVRERILEDLSMTRRTKAFKKAHDNQPHYSDAVIDAMVTETPVAAKKRRHSTEEGQGRKRRKTSRLYPTFTPQAKFSDAVPEGEASFNSGGPKSHTSGFDRCVSYLRGYAWNYDDPSPKEGREMVKAFAREHKLKELSIDNIVVMCQLMN